VPVSGSYGVGTNYLAFTAGSSGAAGTGAFTIAALVQLATGNNNGGFVGLYAGGTDTRAIFVDSLHLYGVNDFSDGFGTLAHDTWYLVGLTKPAGSAPWRMHLWPYASDGSGTMSHGTSTGAGNHGDGSTITQIRLGANEVASNGLIACAAVWTRELSDAELDSMKSAALTAWRDVSGGQPADLISLENWNGTSGAAIPVGTSAYSSTTGTVSSGANPPGFSFTLAAASVLTAAPFTGIAPGRISPSGRFRAGPFVPATGQQYTQSLAGASSSSGSLARQDQKAAAGASAPSGALAKQGDKATAGASTASGAIARQAQKALTAASSPSGALARQIDKVLTAASASAGALANLTAKAFAGASGSSGATSYTRVVLRSFDGSSTPTGALTRAIAKDLAGASTSSGALSRSGGAEDAKATSTTAVTARRTSTDAVTARRTSSGGVS
jgi:hypothetical protein